MISVKSLRNIIRASIQPLGIWSPSAEELLLLTAAHESRLGSTLVQYGNGPALGIYQIEPTTLYDNYLNYIDYRYELSQQIADVCGVSGSSFQHLQYNPIYGTIHARIKYYRDPEALPDASDTWGLANYAKRVFNSQKGAATPQNYYEAYHKLVLT